MNFIDLTGQHLGKLVALKYLGDQKWLCKCDCGKEISVQRGHLRSGHTKSCGCIRSPRIDLTGKRFGRLTALYWIGDGRWRCKCDCGNETDVITYNLQNGTTKSCGCLQKERASESSLKSLIGQKIGKLTVRERIENNRFQHVQYLCDCECGGTVVTEAGRLRQQRVLSCGCIKSIGESKINCWLKEHGVNYRAQYSHDLIIFSSGRRPFFDFAIFDDDKKLLCLIEYQGKHHYDFTGYGWNTEAHFADVIRRDNEKRAACIDLDIPIYELNESDLDNLDAVLTSILFSIRGGV